MSCVKRIEQLLRTSNEVRQKDNAGIITPIGVDMAAEVRGIKRCLVIAKQEEQKLEKGN